MYWLNVDLITGLWKLHKEGCRHCKPRETDFKGLDEMRGHGGWFQFASFEKAYEFYLSQDERHIWQPCKICQPV